MKKVKSIILSLMCISVLIMSCKKDDPGSTDDTDDTAQMLEEAREASNLILTDGDTKTWKIVSAVLENNTGTIDISDSYNIKDDEFIFSGDLDAGNLEWRQGYKVNSEGATQQQTFLDYYVSPENYTYSFLEDSSDELSSVNGAFLFNIVDDNTILAVLSFDGRSQAGEILTMEMNQKTADDYLSAPSSSLNFVEEFVYESNGVSCCSPGMIGSYTENSFYVVTREDDLVDGNGVPPERIVKFDISSGSVTENLYFQQDFVSKQLHIIDDQLIVIGAQFVNTYNLDLNGDPQTVSHGKSISRYGMAVQDDIAYLIGGDLNDDPMGNPIDADKIFGWNLDTQTLSNVATMPASRFGARGTIINNKLYVFGGSEDFYSQPAFNTIFVHDLGTGDINTLNLPYEPNFTYVDKRENLIYVAGQIREEDPLNFDLRLGVFDTLTGTYTDIVHNLDDSDDNSTIYGMTTFNDKMYVLYGNGETMGANFSEWSIMSVDL